jgi:hypothetical protein
MPIITRLRLGRFESVLISSAAGSALGLLALFLEAAVAGAPPIAGAAAIYSLAGGVAGAGGRTLVPKSPYHGGAAGTTLAAFTSLHLLYFANVKLLPGEHYLSGKSLVVDVVFLAVVLVPLAFVVRAPWVLKLRVRWGRAVAALGAALLGGSAGLLVWVWPPRAPDPRRTGAGPNLLLIVMDSVRGDRLSPAGEAHPATPSLHEQAQRGRSFTSAWAASSWTVPSVASMLGQNGAASAQRASLPERLVANGYVSACFTDNPHLTRGSQILRGFDRVERSVPPWRSMLRGTVLGEICDRLDPGDDHSLTSQAIEWAARQRGPLFIYLHLMDSHTPYRFPPIDGKRRKGRRIEFPFTGMTMTADEARDVVARYDGGVLSADAQAGRIIDAAATWGRPFLAAITSDHGESLGEGGRWFHGQSLAPELLAIPLVVVGQAVVPRHVDTPVGHHEIVPTLLAAAGVRCPDCGGIDLRRETGSGIVEGGLPPRLAYRIDGPYKAVLDLESGTRHLFDRRNDPEERRDLAAEIPALAERLTSGLAQSLGQAPPSAPESLERLRSLGYSGS